MQTDFGLNAVAVDARVGDVSDFTWSARTEYGVTVTDQGGLDFEFHLNGGQLAVDTTGAAGWNLPMAIVGVIIKANSSSFSGSLWEWKLVLREVNGNLIPQATVVVDPFGLGVPALGPITVSNGRAVMDIGSFTAATSLGPLSTGHPASVSYFLDAEVSGSFGVGGEARLGDPFNVTGNGTGMTLTLQPANAVPEPSTLLLGVVALATMGRRLRQRQH